MGAGTLSSPRLAHNPNRRHGSTPPAFEKHPRLCYPNTMSKLKAAIGFAVLVGIGVLVLGRYLVAVRASTLSEQGSACAALQGQPFRVEAPDFTLPDLMGRKRSLAELRGKVVLLNFWFTGCPPCVDELPSLLELRRRLAGQPFELLTVSVDESADEVKQFLQKHKIGERELPTLLDPSKKIPGSYGTSKYPETFLIDPQGVVRQKFVFKRDWASPAALGCITSVMR
jgi:peroxiredoxin